MSEQVLFVDDEPNILNAFKRQLRSYTTFEMKTAPSGKRGLEMIKEEGPFAVVVADMMMPEMNGVEFLTKVREQSPDSVRMMLTGLSDRDTAIQAINRGNIFRFLTKPCSSEDLTLALEAALEQHRLIVSEKDLLQNTLSGSVKVLTDILQMVDPAGFGEAVHLRDDIRLLADVAELSQVWELELTAMLANIGSVVMPSLVSIKLQNKLDLSTEEQEIVERVPEVGSNLLKNIPRLGKVADGVLYQSKSFDGKGFPNDSVSGEKIPLSARVLFIVRAYRRNILEGDSEEASLQKLKQQSQLYDPKLLAALEKAIAQTEEAPPVEEEMFELSTRELVPGQKLLADIETSDGVLLITAGVKLNATLIERLVNYEKLVGLKGPVVVDCRIPTREDS